MTFLDPIELLLFSQHGMTDNNIAMSNLAYKVAPPKSHVIAPNLELFPTLFEIEPLISKIEKITKNAFLQYPDTPARILATSLGGVIWIEVLARNPEWWTRIESLVLLGSPIGGADLARILDPFSWGVGMAKYLGQNRRALAEKITAKIPTLVIAGNLVHGTDGTVPVESTKLKHSQFVCLDGVTHSGLRKHPVIFKTIQEFWSTPAIHASEPSEDNLISKLIDHFRNVPGITDASERYFQNAEIVVSFKDGTNIRTYSNILGVNHIFIENKYGQCKYAAFVGWIHSSSLCKTIKYIPQYFQLS